MIVNQNTQTANIQRIQNQPQTKAVRANFGQDLYCAENPYIDKKVFVEKGIIKNSDNINQFFNDISHKIFPDSNTAQFFLPMLQYGFVSLSSSAYTNLDNPKSAVGIKLDKNKTATQHCAYLEEYLSNGQGVGINFSEFEDPIDSIKKINEYFKYREKSLKRPPAGIALLNIDHPKILDFISLKDNADFKDWCFDLSVVIDDEFLSKVDNNEEITLPNGEKMSAQKIYYKLLNSMHDFSEPGIIFSNDKNYLCDCCACAPLKENEGLSLAQINLSKFYNPNTKTIDYNFLSQCAAMISQAMQKIDSNGYVGVLGYQELLNHLGLNYGEKRSLEVLEKCLKIIQNEAHASNVKTAISPTGTISRFLKTTPSIEPVSSSKNPALKDKVSYYQEIDAMITAQKYLDGNISKTICLKPNHTVQDVDMIVRYCAKNKIKGISVFQAKNPN